MLTTRLGVLFVTVVLIENLCDAKPNMQIGYLHKVSDELQNMNPDVDRVNKVIADRIFFLAGLNSNKPKISKARQLVSVDPEVRRNRPSWFVKHPGDNINHYLNMGSRRSLGGLSNRGQGRPTWLSHKKESDNLPISRFGGWPLEPEQKILDVGFDPAPKDHQHDKLTEALILNYRSLQKKVNSFVQKQKILAGVIRALADQFVNDAREEE